MNERHAEVDGLQAIVEALDAQTDAGRTRLLLWLVDAYRDWIPVPVQLTLPNATRAASKKR